MTARARGRNFGGVMHRLIYVSGTLLMLLMAVYFVLSYFFDAGYSPLGNFEGPVVAKYEDGDRVFLLTGQYRTVTHRGQGRTGRMSFNFYIDLWAFDAATTKPLWRKRLDSERGGGYGDRTLMGVHGRTVWLMIRRNIVAVSAEDGSVLLAKGDLEDRNPELQGLMPTEERYFDFDNRGLLITAADARQWRIDPDSFKVIPLTPDTPPDPKAFPPVFYTPNGTQLHLVRGVESSERWLGMMTDAEAKHFEEYNSIGDNYDDERRKMWSAKIVKQSTFFGEQPDYVALTQVPGTTDYLGGKFLREYAKYTNLPAIKLGNPESVLLLSRDRLGDAGKLRLARVAVADGKILWDASLPLTQIQSVRQLENAVVLFGIEHIEGDPEIRDSLRDSPGRLVALDLANGTPRVFSLSALETHLKPVKINVGR
jgi:hypothetical protein